ncbi:MAG: hypothetical protein IT212_07725 [Bacteroidia bacterium]|nr:hypothetical protein [Bacteroidia bacterium]
MSKDLYIVVRGSPGEDGIVVSKELIIKEIYTMAYTESISEVFIKMDKSSINLAFYLVDNYGVDGEFIWGGVMASRFGSWLIEKGHEPYHRMTMDRSMKDLVCSEFLLRIGRGHYAINPKYFYRGAVGMRLERIKELYEWSLNYNKKGSNEG